MYVLHHVGYGQTVSDPRLSSDLQDDGADLGWCRQEEGVHARLPSLGKDPGGMLSDAEMNEAPGLITLCHVAKTCFEKFFFCFYFISMALLQKM